MDAKEEVRQRYDNSADERYQDDDKLIYLYSNISPVMRYFRMRKVEAAMQLGNFKKGAKVLEIGANVGQYTNLLAEKGLSMVGIDLSEKAIVVAKKTAEKLKLKNIEYYPMDVENLALLKDEMFDGVVSFSTLRYVPDLKKALKEIYRVTKKGGVVALDFPNKHCPWFRLLKNKFGVENHIHDHFYSGKELKALFAEAGFTDMETRKIMFTHYTFSPKLLKIFEAIDWVFERIPLVKETAAIVFCKGMKR